MAEVQVVTAREAVAVAAERVARAVAEVHASRRGRVPPGGTLIAPAANDPLTSVRLAIPGGSAAAAVGVVRRELGAEVWRRVRLTWVDERCVDFADERSNRGVAYGRGWLEPADPCELELPLFLDDETQSEALERVQRGLTLYFAGGLDVVLLGLGEDGHIASLFPEHPASRALGGAVAVTDSPKPPALRLSLTVDLLARASHVILLATGEQKRDAIERVLEGDPALCVSQLGAVQLVTDLELGS